MRVQGEGPMWLRTTESSMIHRKMPSAVASEKISRNMSQPSTTRLPPTANAAAPERSRLRRTRGHRLHPLRHRLHPLNELGM